MSFQPFRSHHPALSPSLSFLALLVLGSLPDLAAFRDLSHHGDPTILQDPRLCCPFVEAGPASNPSLTRVTTRDNRRVTIGIKRYRYKASVQQRQTEAIDIEEVHGSHPVAIRVELVVSIVTQRMP